VGVGPSDDAAFLQKAQVLKDASLGTNLPIAVGDLVAEHGAQP
jgi:hypothetical protein